VWFIVCKVVIYLRKKILKIFSFFLLQHHVNEFALLWFEKYFTSNSSCCCWCVVLLMLLFCCCVVLLLFCCFSILLLCGCCCHVVLCSVVLLLYCFVAVLCCIVVVLLLYCVDVLCCYRFVLLLWKRGFNFSIIAKQKSISSKQFWSNSFYIGNYYYDLTRKISGVCDLITLTLTGL
jgi:hypothetical protein